MTLTERDRVALLDIVAQCSLVSERLAMIDYDKRRFEEESLYRDGCAFCLLQIGEAANRLSEETKASLPEINWHGVVGMRNIIAHAYGRYDVAIAWQTATEDIPDLSKQCLALLEREA